MGHGDGHRREHGDDGSEVLGGHRDRVGDVATKRPSIVRLADVEVDHGPWCEYVLWEQQFFCSFLVRPIIQDLCISFGKPV